MSPQVVVAYSGVHQAFQLALAAHELGELREFWCSLYDAPGTMGGLLTSLSSPDRMQSRRVTGLPARLVREFPLPVAAKVALDRLGFGRPDDWLGANELFDRWVARKLRVDPPAVFVGTETCDLHCLEALHGRAHLVHDCPQFHPAFLERVLVEAAERARLPRPRRVDSPAMADRKQREYDLADTLLVYSEVHRRSFEEAGFAPDRMFECPLWVDTDFWRVARPELSRRGEPLRALFVGSTGLRKGLPFLLDALKQCAEAVQLTVVGPPSADTANRLQAAGPQVRVLGTRLKAQLRDIYAAHDVLVLPSVADTFGFVAVEAMACGLPVILTENCGAPVPSPDWRVPAMVSEALAERLTWYADDLSRVAEDAALAVTFAEVWTPQRYRTGIQRLLSTRLGRSLRMDSKTPVPRS